MAGHSPLERRLRDRIRAVGPITFAEFMDAALYDADHGFYAEPPIGERGDFVTSPHVSPGFGILLARCAEDMWIRLGRPAPFSVVEAGAGDGTLAARMLASLPEELRDTGTYVGVERSAGARRSLGVAARDAAPSWNVKVLDDWPSVGAHAAGVVLANEVLDNVPFHRVRGTPDGPVELRVGVGDGGGSTERFMLIESPLPADLAALTPGDLAPGEEAVVSPAALSFLERASGILRRGYLLVIDYGQPPRAADPRTASPVHGYRRHRVEDDVLAAPGSCDITAGIDTGALLTHARRIGLTAWPPLTQREALLHLGLADWSGALRERQAEALRGGRGAEATRIYSARNAARLLIDPAGLGSFTVLCFGVGHAPRPTLLLDGDRTAPATPAT